jgi:hypothetical protein
MSDDLNQTIGQGEEARQVARTLSEQHRVPPTEVPGYKLEHCLGEGAYGEVWVAVDVNNPGRRVAVKFYTRRGGDWSLLAREVEKLNFLATDRYVVQLLDVGWNATPPYYVMEYMENGSLAERLEGQGPLPVAEALELFHDVATGVVNAHNRGVLHCDLKPANVLLGSDCKPRLADFGQSRLSNEQTPALGTLFYMAPEQADLKAAPDARWDVYALGALLYCLLVGEQPYRDAPGAEALKEGGPLDERLARYRKLLQESHRPRKHRKVPGIDRALVEIIDRCLAVSPARRFPNVQAVLSALDARAIRRARRPLLVMGALAPILLLAVMGFLIRLELQAAVHQATAALTDETRDSNTFAAQAVAEKVAGKIDRRWRTLEQVAANLPFKKALEAARGKAFRSPEQQHLQAMLEEAYRAHPDVKADSWGVFDDDGTFLAHAPYKEAIASKFIGQRFAYRDFFTGLDHDLDKNEVRPALTRVHRSNVFLSSMTGTRKVAFSVPVWKGKTPAPDEAARHPRAGVVMMTVEVGSFAELGGQDGDDGKEFAAVLVDGRTGAILEHPLMARLRREVHREDNPEKTRALEQELEIVLKQRDWLQPGGWDPEYHDPVSERHPEYAGDWMAATQPVRIEERGKDVRDTGWWVIVQEKHDRAIGPVIKLRDDMISRGRWAVVMSVIVVTGLWLFVIVVLNESGGSRLFRFLRRRAGLASESLGSLKGSLRGPKRSLVPPGAATVTDRHE